MSLLQGLKLRRDAEKLAESGWKIEDFEFSCERCTPEPVLYMGRFGPHRCGTCVEICIGLVAFIAWAKENK